MEGQLKLLSLGRIAFIGELYNARTESFSSRSLLKSTTPSNLITCQDIYRTEFDYKVTERISEKFELMKVEGELQMSVLLGLINIEGSGSFLVGEQTSERSVCYSLICNMSTVCDKFFAPFTEIIHCVDLTALEDLENTHIVTEVYWGAQCLLSLTANSKSESSKNKLKGQLSAKLEKLKNLLSVKGKASMDMRKLFSEGDEDLSVKVCADIVPDGGWPTSIEGFCQLITDLPDLVKKVNNGKGKPVNYVLMPLTTLRKVAKLSTATDVVVRTIDDSFLMSIVYFLEEIAVLKRKLQDSLDEMTEKQKYVMETDLKAARSYQQDLVKKEADFKHLISSSWVQVKSGEKSLVELTREVEKCKNRHLHLYSYEEYLESTDPIQKKLATVTHMTSLGVLYLGRGDSFDFVLSKNLSSEFLVLVVSSGMQETHQDLYLCTMCYFLTEVEGPRPNTKYVVVDLDYQKNQVFMNINVTEPKCFHLAGTRIVSKDKFGDYLVELSSNFVRLKEKVDVVPIKHKPGNRVPLELVCPGFQTGTCDKELLSWTCFRCKGVIEYGFDDFFYCCCGKGPIINMEFRCSDPKHGNFFITGKTEFIRNGLKSLRPLKEMNVLILGQSGVGKSTWINSIVNYLNFETLDSARENGVICTIPASIVVHDSVTLKEYVVKIGEEDTTEVTTIGHSATQFARTYSFMWGGKCVRLIDSPGLGDTRGLEQDKQNLQNIINHIGHLKELHGVCILLRANDSRISAIFSYCLKELLVHLHRSITKNIVFCFTNARNSLYTPGQTSAVLQRLICHLGAEKDIALGHHNMFCLDNEAFIFLCSLSHPEIKHEPKLVEYFAHSWQISLNETLRLFETIRTFEPHLLKETLSLVSIRQRITNLSKPIAEISKTIQMNLATIQRKQMDIRNANENLEELSKDLTCMEIYLQSAPLNYSRTVCTSPSCVEYHTFQNLDVSEIEYKTHCHKQCYLKNVTVATVNNAELRNCDAMGKDGKCRNCGCGWQNHMHMTTSQERVERPAVNKRVEAKWLKKKSEKEKIEIFVKDLENLVKQYQEEQEFIIQASVKFGMFLRRNAITVYNDSVADYMQYLIDEEERKPYKSETENNLLQSMKDMLAHYNAEVAVLMEVIRKGENNDEELSIDEILELEKKLYSLELTGESIRKYAECDRNSNAKAFQYAETPLRIPGYKKSSTIGKSGVRPTQEYKKSFLKEAKDNFFKFFH